MVNFDIDCQEIGHLQAAVEFADRHLLEIGCGSGRLTTQLAPKTKLITAIDPDKDLIAQNSSDNRHDNISYLVADTTSLPFDDHSFDIVLFSLSLCCVEPEEEMRTAALEAIRVLRPGGYLISIMPSTTRNFDAGWMWYYLDPSHQAQIFDMSVAAARMVLKQVCFNDSLLEFVEERRVQTRWSYDSPDEMRDKWHSRYEEFVEEHDIDNAEHRKRFEEHLEQFLEQMPMVFDMFEEMQITRKCNTNWRSK